MRVANLTMDSCDTIGQLLVLLGTQQMQALSTYNKIVRQWSLTKDYFTVNLQTLLYMCAMPYTDIREVTDTWRSKVKITGVEHKLTAIQLLTLIRAEA